MNAICMIVCALAVESVCLPGAAYADDPHDAAMRHPAARAADSAVTKRLNDDQLSYVRRRDAETMQSFDGARNANAANYAAARVDYDRQMAMWRFKVSACNAGRWEYCKQ